VVIRLRIAALLPWLAATALTLAGNAFAYSTGAPFCNPVTGMGGSPHGATPSGSGGFYLQASTTAITGAPVTFQLLNQAGAATFTGLYLETTDGTGNDLGAFTAPASYKLLTCAGLTGPAITSVDALPKSTPSATFTWTPPASPTLAESIVVVHAIIVVSLPVWHEVTLNLRQQVTAVGPGDPGGVQLAANSPNPFRGSTLISYSLAGWSPVHLVIEDVSGRRVRLLDASYHAAGSHAVRWNGLDDQGRAAPPGVYFYRLEIPGYSAVRRAVMLSR